MCNVCCKEFRGWCKSFTRTEALLSLLEAVLLLVLIVLLTFFILHLLACSKSEVSYEIPSSVTVTPAPTVPPPNETSSDVDETTTRVQPTRDTLSPDVQCTWEPSQKTAATTHYYEDGAVGPTRTIKFSSETRSETKVLSADVEFTAGAENSDGDDVEDGVESFVLALVKLQPARESVFGCVLSVVSRHWALTAASCVEAVEEVDSLDAFVMLERYGAGAGAGRAHAVAAVHVHPQYARAGGRGAGDLAALRSEDALPAGRLGLLQLPTVLDHLLLTIGERMTILGYGPYRTPESSSSDRRVRAVSVFSLPGAACEGEGEGEGEAGWAPRHLAGGAPTLPATGDIGPICAGVLYSRGGSCNYCAGAPLLRAGVLLGVRAGGRCDCAPAAYAGLAPARDWLDEVISTTII